MQSSHRKILAAVAVLLATISTAFAAGGHQLPLNAENLSDSFIGQFFTNSSIMVWISTILIVLFCRAAAGKISMR